VEPWPDDLVLVPGLLPALELRDRNTVHQDLIRIPQ
jgi:hypothetical protein